MKPMIDRKAAFRAFEAWYGSQGDMPYASETWLAALEWQAAQEARKVQPTQPYAIEGLVWAVAAGNNPEIAARFDTPQQAHGFVSFLKQFIEPSRKENTDAQ